MGRRTPIAQVAAVLLLAGGLAACGDDGGGSGEGPVPTAWSAEDATNTSDADGEKADDDAYKVAQGETAKWEVLELPAGGKSAMVDPETWPDVKTVLSQEQMDGIFPDADFGDTPLCASGSYESDGGGLTPHNTQCTWTTDSYDNNDRVRLSLRGIGADSAVVKAWDEKRSEYRAENGDGNTFYKDGTYGARRALYLTTGLGSFVVSDGEVAAWIDVQYPQKSDFLGGDNGATAEAVRTKSFPTLVETFVTYLPREH